ncbi:DUF417 family protein [Marivita sp. S6314]|uniref:DUF417 family protein n=1 Tax=Marivita sp. S6314 TaxID=2926406 RepID=UPI001FF297F1|nr:DUF417 family protein [Marivita sp. S6314]MCK0152034.1 DUF417 family protein [Marivita sp. S6314]
MTTYDTALTSDTTRASTAADKGLFFSLVAVFLWFGGMKFTAYEAGAIEGLVANSPLLAWLYTVLDVQAVSNLIGTTELLIAVLLALRFVVPAAAVAGAIGAIATFLVTVSFFFTTPGVFLPEHGTFAISVLPGQFLLKDLVLLAASVWALTNALAAARQS